MFMCIWSTLFVILWVESEMAASVYYSTSVYLNVLNRYSTMQWDAGLVFTLSGLSLSSLCFIFQSDIHRNLHLRVCHQSHGTRVHLGSVHLPQRRVELARFHRHHTSVSLYWWLCFMAHTLVMYPCECNVVWHWAWRSGRKTTSNKGFNDKPWCKCEIDSMEEQIAGTSRWE